MKNKIAIIGGTPSDTTFGKQFVLSLGYTDIITFSTANSPGEQNRLQLLQPDILQNLCEKECQKWTILGYTAVLIYCNSLSSVLDLEQLQRICGLHVISPRDVYRTVAKEYNKIMVLAANASGAKLVEQSLLQGGCEKTTTFGCLDIVDAVENQKQAEDIYSELYLGEIVRFSEGNRYELILLSCTHFPYIQQVLQKNSSIPVIDLDMGLKKIL